MRIMSLRTVVSILQRYGDIINGKIKIPYSTLLLQIVKRENYANSYVVVSISINKTLEQFLDETSKNMKYLIQIPLDVTTLCN